MPIVSTKRTIDPITSREVVITYIHTEPGIARKLAIPEQPAMQRLSDDELLKQLSATGKTAGIAWVDGREILLFADAKERNR